MKTFDFVVFCACFCALFALFVSHHPEPIEQIQQSVQQLELPPPQLPDPEPPQEIPPPPKVRPKSNEATESLAEVNATRAKRGLKPFIYDEGLTKAAMGAAAYRAKHLIAGHTSNDFAYLPSGCNAKAAGCGAWYPGDGWGTCCTYENFTHAGAAFVIGRDGRRYMHLFVR